MQIARYVVVKNLTKQSSKRTAARLQMSLAFRKGKKDSTKAKVSGLGVVSL